MTRVVALLTTVAFLNTLLFPPSVLAFVHTATQSFGYDDLNRLTSATGSYGALTYAYDPLGNMLLKDGTTTMTYGELPVTGYVIALDRRGLSP